jgi:hypothetical protein
MSRRFDDANFDGSDLLAALATPANDNNLPFEIIAPRASDFRSVSAVHRIAIVVNALGESRRSMAEWVTQQFLAFDARGGRFVRSDGVVIDLVDPELGMPEDGSFTWFSDLKKFAKHPPRQMPQERILARLRFIYLAIAIWRPEIAAQILR